MCLYRFLLQHQLEHLKNLLEMFLSQLLVLWRNQYQDLFQGFNTINQ